MSCASCVWRRHNTRTTTCNQLRTCNELGTWIHVVASEDRRLGSSMSQMHVMQAYRGVVDDVIGHVRVEFQEEGIDEYVRKMREADVQAKKKTCLVHEGGREMRGTRGRWSEADVPGEKSDAAGAADAVGDETHAVGSTRWNDGSAEERSDRTWKRVRANHEVAIRNLEKPSLKKNRRKPGEEDEGNGVDVEGEGVARHCTYEGRE